MDNFSCLRVRRSKSDSSSSFFMCCLIFSNVFNCSLSRYHGTEEGNFFLRFSPQDKLGYSIERLVGASCARGHRVLRISLVSSCASRQKEMSKTWTGSSARGWQPFPQEASVFSVRRNLELRKPEEGQSGSVEPRTIL